MRDYYQEIKDILGPQSCIFAAGDDEQENAAHTTFLTVGNGSGNGLTVTYSSDRDTWVNPFTYIRNKERIPLLDFDGTNDEADTPDIDFFSRNDASGEALSMGGVVNIEATAGIQTILNKGNQNEWQFAPNADEKLQFGVFDASAGVNAVRISDDPIPLSQFVKVGMTYDGGGGATAANGIILYVRGLVVPSTATNNGSYVAMEPGTGVVELGERANEDRFAGKMLGGQGGVYFTEKLLSAVEEFRLNKIYEAMQRADRSRVLAGVL